MLVTFVSSGPSMERTPTTVETGPISVIFEDLGN